MSSSKFENLWRLMTLFKFEVDDEIPADVICAICSKLMIEPYAAACGCQFCGVCIKNYISDGSQRCPVDKDGCCEEELKIDKNVFKDVRTNHIIKKIVVKCPNERCSLKTQLEKIEDHLNICEMKPIPCLFRSLGCVNDGIIGDNVNDHLIEATGEHAILLVQVIEHMKRDMDQLKQKDLFREENLRNLREEGEMTKKDLVYVREELEELKNRVETIMNDKWMEKLKYNESATMEMKEEVNDIKLKVADLALIKSDGRQMSNSGFNRMVSPAEVVRERDNNVSKGDTEDGSIKMSLETQLMKLNDTKVAAKNKSKTVKEKYITQEDFVWMIDDFSRKVGSYPSMGKVHHSEPFTRENYKLRLSCKLTELQGLSDNLYLELYLVIMKGEKDGLVEWPMRSTVRLGVVNQMTKALHRVGNYSLETHKGQPHPYQRPLKDTNEVIGGLSLAVKDIRVTPCLSLSDAVMVCCSLLPPPR